MDNHPDLMSTFVPGIEKFEFPGSKEFEKVQIWQKSSENYQSYRTLRDHPWRGLQKKPSKSSKWIIILTRCRHLSLEFIYLNSAGHGDSNESKFDQNRVKTLRVREKKGTTEGGIQPYLNFCVDTNSPTDMNPLTSCRQFIRAVHETIFIFELRLLSL